MCVRSFFGTDVLMGGQGPYHRETERLSVSFGLYWNACKLKAHPCGRVSQTGLPAAQSKVSQPEVLAYILKILAPAVGAPPRSQVPLIPKEFPTRQCTGSGKTPRCARSRGVLRAPDQALTAARIGRLWMHFARSDFLAKARSASSVAGETFLC